MSNRKSVITLKDYLTKGKTFVIPDYQRGYVWGKSRKVNNKEDRDSVTYMLESIHDGFCQYIPIFIQGVTVCEERDQIIIIDGQQRTTFFYLLLCYLQYQERFEIEYNVRTESKSFLKNLKPKTSIEIVNMCQENPCENYQDIYYFKKTIRLIDETIKRWGVDFEKLRDYLLHSIQFLYIDIPEPKAKTVFRMMNGNKANMTDEDLLKAEILRLISVDTDDTEIILREQDLLRSRYAREWDRWLRWWNQKKVKSFYKTTDSKHPLSLLLTTYHHSAIKEDKEDYNFENFRARLLLTKEDARKTFNELRHLQKRFEDTYNDTKIETHLHNTIGGILVVLAESKESLKFIYDYFSGNITNEKLDLFYKLSFMGGIKYPIICKIAKGEDLSEKEEEEYTQARDILYAAINSDDMYNNPEYKKIAFRQLLHLNIEYDSNLGRMFNFFAYENRSIEHIFPKSRVYYDNGVQPFSCEENKPVTIDSSWIDFDDLQKNNCSQHCIGNFALLYVVNNSKLGNKSFSEKKAILFGTKNEEVDVFQSRELLHTISLFASEKWGVDEISKNKQKVVDKLKNYYGIK